MESRIYHIIVDKYHVGTSNRALIRDIIHTRPAYRVRGNRYNPNGVHG